MRSKKLSGELQAPDSIVTHRYDRSDKNSGGFFQALNAELDNPDPAWLLLVPVSTVP